MFSEYTIDTDFKSVLPGQMFVCNGTLARKTSSRTGIVYYPAAPYKKFYYGQGERVRIQKETQ